MEDEQDWVFTFGYGHEPGIGFYVKIYGTKKSARAEMFRQYEKWAFQYASEDAAGVKEYHLMEIHCKILGERTE